MTHPVQRAVRIGVFVTAGFLFAERFNAAGREMTLVGDESGQQTGDLESAGFKGPCMGRHILPVWPS